MSIFREPERGSWRARLGVWVEGDRFQNFIIALIVLNAITLGLETVPLADQSFGALIDGFERVVLLVFVAEIALKLLAFGPRFFLGAWNNFDFAIVALSLLPASGPLAILRALRVLRLLRLLHAVPRLRLIIEGVLRVLPDMGWVFALLSLVFYIFAVLGTKLYGAQFPNLFGNIGMSFFTLFQVMTLESWSTGVARPIMEVFPASYLYFVPFVLVTSFLILNMVIGVVVNGFQAVMQGEPVTPGVPPHGDSSRQPTDIEAEIAGLHQKLDALLAAQNQTAEKTS